MRSTVLAQTRLETLALVASLATFTVLAASPAQAQEGGDERARLHFRTAQTYYDAGDYESALHEFQEAYDHSHRAELLWNLYLTHERLGQFEQAVGALESFLEGGHPGFERPVVESRLEHLRSRVQRRQAGDADEGDAQADPDTAPQVAEPVDTTPVVAIAGFSVAAVGVVGFAVFGALTLTEDDALWQECGEMCPTSRTEALGLYAVATDISAAVALAGAVLGVVGLLIAPSQSDGQTSSALRWGVGLGSVGVEGSF